MARVVVAMSGGVDSSVAAALLKEQGHEVIGITMQIWPEGEGKPHEKGCCSVSAVEDARKVAFKLGIDFYVLNFRDLFQKQVIDYFIDEYCAGRTPNPCIMCNRKIKFEHLLQKAKSFGADFLATGHYARIEEDEQGRPGLKKGLDEGKDQSYALYNLTQEQLKQILFPLGNFEKDKTRELAKKFDLPVHSKAESQEICFVEDNQHGDFIAQKKPDAVRPGIIVDEQGNVLGKHRGLPYYTVGQRRGLGLAMGYPVYVKEIRADKNEIVVGPQKSIYSEGLLAHDINWIGQKELEKPQKVEIKIRYNAPAVKGEIRPRNGEVIARFFKPIPAVTPGQSVVFYRVDEVLGGGIIKYPIDISPQLENTPLKGSKE